MTPLLLRLNAATLGKAGDLNLPDVHSTPDNLKTILSLVFIGVGVLAVCFIIWGGFRYVIAAGSPEDTKKAKDILVFAIVGLVIALLAISIVNFVVGRFV